MSLQPNESSHPSLSASPSISSLSFSRPSQSLLPLTLPALHLPPLILRFHFLSATHFYELASFWHILQLIPKSSIPLSSSISPSLYSYPSTSLDHLATADGLLNSRCAALNDDRRRSGLWFTHKYAHTHTLSEQPMAPSLHISVPSISAFFSFFLLPGKQLFMFSQSASAIICDWDNSVSLHAYAANTHNTNVRT